MIKPTVVVLAALLLAGCVTTKTEVITRHYVLDIPEDLYACHVARWPDHRTLTDVQVAYLLKELHRANVTCKTSLDGIRQYVDAARKIKGGAQ